MFERLTEQACAVVVRASEEARTLGHTHLGTEHLLLGLIGEERGVGARVLAAVGVRLEGARAEVVRLAGVGDVQTGGQIPFSDNAKTVFRQAAEEADALAQEDVASHHLLLALLRLEEGTALRVLDGLGATPESLTERVLANLDEAPQETRQAQAREWVSRRTMSTILLAFEEAKRYRHDYLGTEHLLLGLLGEGEGTAFAVLESFEITLDRVREQVSRIVGTAEPSRTEITWTQHAGDVIGQAESEARSRGHGVVEPEHLLLGMAQTRSCLGARILLAFDAEPESISRKVDSIDHD